MKRNSIRAALLSVAGVLALSLTACQQSSGGTTPTSNTETGAVATASSPAPAPFDKKGVKVAIVQQSGQGDYFQQYLNGTKQQASALGVDLQVYDAQGDNAQQAAMLEQAIQSNPAGIIVRHGNTDTLCPGVNEALTKKIPIVIYDVAIQECAPKAVQTQQDDAVMAGLVLDQMAKDIGTGANVGYVNVAGVAPLDRRNAVWTADVTKYQWKTAFKTGAFTNSSATDTAPMVSAAVQAHKDIKAIYAPYDEFTKGTLTGLDQVPGTDNIKVYGADISNADIELMKAANSRWVATGATDPNAIGAAVFRTLALLITGSVHQGDLVKFPPILVTQQMLRDKNINNMADLRKVEPTLNISKVSSADWIPTVSF